MRRSGMGLTKRLALIFGIMAGCFFVPALQAQNEPPAVLVNGSALITNEPLRQIRGEWTLPLKSLSRRVGAEIRVENNSVLRVRRSDGGEILYDGSTGEIRDRFLIIGRIAAYREIQLSDANPELMFPISAVVAVLDVEARFDADRNVIVVETNQLAAPHAKSEGSPLTFADADYVYGLNTNFKQTGHVSALRSTGMLGNMKVTESLTTNVTPAGSLQFVQTSVRLENRSTALTLGDQAGTPAIEFLSAPVRGAGYERKVGAFRSSFYGGRARRTNRTETLGFSGQDDSYNTTVGGFSLDRISTKQQFTLAGNAFSDSKNKGATLGAAFGRLTSTNQFRSYAGIGSFSKGMATAMSVSDAFSPFRQVSLTGTVEHYGANFLAVRDDARFTGNSAAAGSVTIRPLSYVSATGGWSYRQFMSGAKGTAQSRSFALTGRIPGSLPVILSAFHSSNVDSTSAVPRIDISQYSVSVPALRRYTLYSNYTVMRTGSERIETWTANAGTEMRSIGRLGFHTQVQLRHNNTVGADWQLPIGKGDQYIRIGLDRVQTGLSPASLRPVMGLNVPLGKSRNLQVSYTTEGGSRSLQATVRTPIFAKKSIVTNDRGVSSVVQTSSVNGRVFADLDSNAKFDESTDRPIADIRVWLDDERSVTTDSHGMFWFDQVASGAHRIRAEINSLPADLVFAETDTRVVPVVPGRINSTQFRVVRTGKVLGKLSYMDYTQDPSSPVERSMADGRIVIVKPDLDSYSEANGTFTFGDLAPGTYELKVASETIPAGYVAVPASVRVEVKAGESAQNVRFTIMQAPRQVVEKRLPM
jgi:hypothetical protein